MLINPDFAKKLVQRGGYLFSKRKSLMTLWQEIADNFYVERADFTICRYLGQDFAANLTTSYPLLARRTLGDIFSSMLRPTNVEWFKVVTSDEDELSAESKIWLEDSSKRLRRAMYDRKTQFTRATKEADHDYATFGQCVIMQEWNYDDQTLAYQTFHLRDVAWSENPYGEIDTVYRKWNPTITNLIEKMGKDRVHDNMLNKAKLGNDPYDKVSCFHIVMPTKQYKKCRPETRDFITPYVSIYVDIENNHVMEEVGVWNMMYIIPRWATVSGSQYAYSPATVAALPDARLIQAQTLTLLEAGEKAVNPPMIATNEVVKSSIDIFAGGITWVDKMYDERLGASLRPINQDFRGLPLGFEMRDRTTEQIMEAFYLNKINLPQPTADMTATEVSFRMKEYIRNALPLFEPVENEYNAQLCVGSFDTALRNNVFEPIPDELRNKAIRFEFESPLHEMVEKEKGQKLMEGKALLAQVIDLDPSVAEVIDAPTALREALTAIGFPTDWQKTDEEVRGIINAQKQQAQAAQMLEQMQQGSQIAEQTGRALESMNNAQVDF